MPAAPLEEKINWSRSTDFPGVEFLAVEHSPRLWRVYHETYTICSIENFAGARGFTEWHYRGKRHVTPQRALMLMEPGEVHDTRRMSGPCSFEVMLIAPALMEGLAEEAGVSGPLHFRMQTAGELGLFAGFARFHAAQARGGTLLERQDLLTRCLGAAVKYCGEKPLRRPASPGRAILLRARDYLEAHWASEIALADLARVAGLSRFHFLRAFTLEFGLPPHAYQIKIRVEKARLLLRAGVPIREIDVGFADQSHLTRHFKRTYHITPGQYQRLIR